MAAARRQRLDAGADGLVADALARRRATKVLVQVHNVSVKSSQVYSRRYDRLSTV